MGLDMFLLRIKDNNDSEEVYYWRKAYPVMDWFENRFNGVGNLEDYPVTKEDFISLKNFCEKVVSDGHFHEMDEFKNIVWTSEYELTEWFDWNMDSMKSTAKFLSEFLENNEDWDNIIFKAWW